jgi:NADPH-dependent 7-cyano-7-deazaguanine reductase QueF
MIKLTIEVSPQAIEVFNNTVSKLDPEQVHVMATWWMGSNLKIKMQFETEFIFKEFVRKWYF